MLNNIIKASLSNRLAVVVVSALILIAGMVVMMRTEVDIFPDLNAPTVAVMTEAPGMAPEEVERSVTYPIETAVNGAAGVRRVRSSSTTGFSVVWVEFDWGEDVYRARQTVSEKLTEVNGKMPPGVGTPTLGSQSSILGEIYIIGLTSKIDSVSGKPLVDGLTLRTIADRQIRPRLKQLGGVSQVSIIGGDVKEYRISLSPARMQMMGVSLQQVRDALSNFNANAPGGVVYDYGNEYIVKGSVATTSAEDLGEAAVLSEMGADGEMRSVRLSDVADISVGGQEPRLGLASVNAQPAVIITVAKQPGASTIKLNEEIDQTLAGMDQTLPKGVEVHTDIFRQADFIDTSISNLQESLFVGAIFVIVILFFFLMNLRTTLISLVALPLSIIVTMIALNLFGLSINTMSLGGIAIAIGSLVDDAIVDVENVYKRLRRRRDTGESVLKIVFDASKEVRMPIFNSSLIIMASFVPLFFLGGMEGKLLKPLGISFIVALFASTLVALTVTPVLCSYLLGSKKAMATMSKEPWLSRKLRVGYERLLGKTLSNPKPVLYGTGGLFLLSIVLLFTLGSGFLPPFNEGSFTINVSTLPGISLERSDEVGREAERIILSMPEIERTARKTGRAELDEHSLGVNVSEIEAPYKLKDRSKSELTADLRKQLAKIPGVNIEVGQPISHRIDAMLSGTQAQIAIKLFGDDLNTLMRLGNQIKGKVSTVPGVVDVNIEQQMMRPQLDIRPRREMLAYYGITPGEFAEFVETAMAGETVGQVYENGWPTDITLKFEPEARDNAEAIESMTIDTPRGKVPLSALADVVSAAGPNSINRENVSRRIVISANVQDRDLGGTVKDIEKTLASSIQLPEGYYLTYSGQFENQKSATQTLVLVSALAFILIFLLLYGQYKSVSESVLIMLNMPLAIIGGVIILWLTGGELNIPAVIGFISLMGIATRNGMLLISHYDERKEIKETLRDRVIEGSVDRLNPILMTALSSALALIPIAVNGKLPGNEIQSPLAIVILGGLLSSTLLNVFVVPILYTRLQERIARKKAAQEQNGNNNDSNNLDEELN